MKEYDDECELTGYIWNFYGRFMTPIELKVSRAVFAEAKRAIGHAGYADFIWRQHKLADEPAVMSELADGTEAFRRKVATRILREHAGDIFVNRCPRCNRVVRTPKAQQCPWCFYDWHPRPRVANKVDKRSSGFA